VLAALENVCITLLVLMVIFTAYTVVMRYAFHNPPFWGDTLTLFCNIWLVLIAYAIAVRKREFIAMQGMYGLLPAGWGAGLNMFWNIVTASFGALLAWYGMEAAMNVPGSYWELGGLPNSVPMAIMPLCGVLILLAGARNVVEDVAASRRAAAKAPAT
jgi:TRAP-type C4-dicarboxylate transport system permease small subunit